MNPNSNSGIGLIILIVVLGLIVLLYIRRHFKRMNIPNVFLVTGAVKSGKTLLSVHYAIKIYKRNLRYFYIRKAIFTCLGLGKDFSYPPMLYTNIPLAKVKYNILTFDIIERKVRIPDKSVVLIDEASLLADSMLYANQDINDTLTSFYKLFAHYTHGGTCILDTQSIKDNHYSAKRCIGNYFYIHSRIKLPFISICKVREFISVDDDNTINVIGEDLELSMRKVIIFNSCYKKYDCYAFSSFTDYLDYEVDYEVPILKFDDDLKIYRFVTYQHFGLKMNKDMDEHLKEIELLKQFDENGVKIENEENKDI